MCLDQLHYAIEVCKVLVPSVDTSWGTLHTHKAGIQFYVKAKFQDPLIGCVQ